MGPLKTAIGRYNHIFVAVDKFTRWIEVKPVIATTAAKVANFIEEISHWFRVPNRIITDLGTSFTSSEFWDYCQESCIDIYYASVAHPRCNGQVKRAKRLDPPRAQGQNFQSDRKIRCKVAPRTTQSGLGAPHTEKLGYQLFVILHGLRF